MKKYKYAIQNNKTGEIVSHHDSLIDALLTLDIFINQSTMDGSYIWGLYEIKQIDE